MKFFGIEFNQKEAPARGGDMTYRGFGDRGVVMEDARGRKDTRMPGVSTKGEVLGGDPLAIYKPSGAKSIDAARAMGSFTGFTYAAVNAIAMEAAGIQWRLYQITGKDHKELDEHPLLELLEGVNDTMTGIELKYTMFAHLELTGNFYGLLTDKNRDAIKGEDEQPAAIYPLNPGRVRVKLDKSKYPYRISSYEFTIDGKIFTYKPYQILHVKYPDPNDSFVGIGVPQTIPVWIDSDNYAMEYNRKYFINGAGLGLFLATQTNIEGQIERIKQGFKDTYGGIENAHKIPVLPKGIDIKNVGASHRDMDFGGLSDRTRDRILAAFRVSKTILGTAESDTNRATAETADYVFSKRTMKPKITLVVSYLNEFLVPLFGDDIYLTFLDPVPEDKAARTAEMATAAGDQPVITQNEARRLFMGLGPIDGGDKLLRAANMQEAGTTATPEGEDQTPNLAKTAEGWSTKGTRVRLGNKAANGATLRLRKAMSSTFEKALTKTIEPDNVKSVKDLTKTEYMEHYKRFDKNASAAEEQLVTIFRGINAQQEKEVLENVEKATGVTKDVGDLFDEEQWINITVNLAGPVIATLAHEEAAASLSMIGADDRNVFGDEAVANALNNGISKMATSYNETTLAQLKEKLTEKMTQPGGTNLTELKQTVADVYDYADERRAGLIAKTESYRAANFANRAAWKQSGVVKSLKWYTAEDQKVCPLCAELDGKEIGIDDTFFTDEKGYSNGETPPLHPDCRCYIRPENISIE